MECLRIDESGYTGFDLLNPDQPFQGATAVAISDEDAARLIREHFPGQHPLCARQTSLVIRSLDMLNLAPRRRQSAAAHAGEALRALVDPDLHVPTLNRTLGQVG
jgi:hypothetical protein